MHYDAYILGPGDDLQIEPIFPSWAALFDVTLSVSPTAHLPDCTITTWVPHPAVQGYVRNCKCMYDLWHTNQSQLRRGGVKRRGDYSISGDRELLSSALQKHQLQTGTATTKAVPASYKPQTASQLKPLVVTLSIFGPCDPIFDVIPTAQGDTPMWTWRRRK